MTYKRDTEFAAIKDVSALGQKLDAELDVLSNALSQITPVLSELKERVQLEPKKKTAKEPETPVYVAPEFEPAEMWAPKTQYRKNALCIVGVSVWVGVRDHVSSEVFFDDKAHWLKILDFSPIVDKMQSIAQSSALARINANLNTLLSLAEKIPEILEKGR